MKVFFRYFFVVIAVVVAGFLIGRLTAPKADVASDEIKKDFVTPPTPPKMEVDEKSLILETPIDGARIDGVSVDISGRAVTGEKPVHIILKNPSGLVVTETDTAVIATTGSSFGRFQTLVTIDPAPEEPLTLEVSRVGGTEPATIRVISFGSHEAVTLRSFFAHEGFVDSDSCEEVQPFMRVTTIGGGVYRAAIEMLLQGPNETEVPSGVVTALPKLTKLRAIAADADGVVTADFESSLFKGASECARKMMLAQINSTLNQFPEVRGVIVTIAGVRSELVK